MNNNYSPEWKKRGDRTGLIRNALLLPMLSYIFRRIRQGR